MDPSRDPDLLQKVLEDAGINIDRKDLDCPTEDFVVYIIIEYFKKFNFDAFEISKSTKEQLECLSHPESYSDVIKVINLHSALSSFCNEIFLKDFSLIDIMSPGPKKSRKQINILFNFLVYVKNKQVENEIVFDDINNKQKGLQNMIDEKDSIILKIGELITEQEKKLALKEHVSSNIQEAKITQKQNNEIIQSLEEKIKSLKIMHQEAVKIRNQNKEKAKRYYDITADLESKIVRSPEEYAAKSKELQNLLKIKKDERNILNDSIIRKKAQIKNNETAHELVKHLSENFSQNTCETLKKLRETSDKLNNLESELKTLKLDINKWNANDIDQSLNALQNNVQQNDKQLLSELDIQHENKQKEKNLLIKNLEIDKIKLNKKKSKLEEYILRLSQNEDEYKCFVKSYQELYNNAITEETELMKTITAKLKK